MTKTFDAIGPIKLTAFILLAIGVIPFTAGWVGLIFILTTIELKFTWR